MVLRMSFAIAAPLLMVLLTAFVTVSARKPQEIFPEDAHIEIAQMGGDRWRVAYNLSRPVAFLDLGPSLNGFRQSDWRVVAGEARLVSRNGRDYLEAAGRKGRFDTVALELRARPHGFQKQYEPIRNLGPDGALVYTGHFWPWRSGGGRIDAAFFFNPMDGARVSVFDRREKRLDRWRSVFNHPAFVYFGPLRAKETDDVVIIADPEAPKWIAKELDETTGPVFQYLENVFRRELRVKPNVFLAYQWGGPDGLLRYSGDALPGQFQLSLYGGGWRKRSPLGVDLIRRATIHESVHLWQAGVHPLTSDEPGWIHEGVADAIMLEALVALGAMQPHEAENEFRKTQAECARELDDGSLAGAEQRGSVRAIYACGHVLARVAAEAHNGAGSVAVFWRDFEARAIKQGGYDADLFYRIVQEKGGDDLGAAMRRFVRTPYARPDKEIKKLLALATQER